MTDILLSSYRSFRSIMKLPGTCSRYWQYLPPGWLLVQLLEPSCRVPASPWYLAPRSSLKCSHLQPAAFSWFSNLDGRTRNAGTKLTFVRRIPGQPFAFGAVGGSDDADRVAALHREVILADFTGHHHLGMVQWLFIPSHLQIGVKFKDRSSASRRKQGLGMNYFNVVLFIKMYNVTLANTFSNELTDDSVKPKRYLYQTEPSALLWTSFSFHFPSSPSLFAPFSPSPVAASPSFSALCGPQRWGLGVLYWKQIGVFFLLAKKKKSIRT